MLFFLLISVGAGTYSDITRLDIDVRHLLVLLLLSSSDISDTCLDDRCFLIVSHDNGGIFRLILVCQENCLSFT